MNQKKKLKNNNELLQLIQRDCRHGNKEGYVNVVKRNSPEHEVTKTLVTHWLLNNGYEVYSEAAFVNGLGKADIIAIQNGQGYAIEILHSETEKRFQAKFEKYPKEFTLVKVDSKSFKYSDFCL